MNDDDVEAGAELENEAIDAMRTLADEHGYSREDLERLIDAALGQ